MKFMQRTLAVLGLALAAAPLQATEEHYPAELLAQAVEGKRGIMSSEKQDATTPGSKAEDSRSEQPQQGKPTILEFGDLQCPDSAAFAVGGRQQLMREFVSSGQATYKFHDFPLDSHPMAAQAAAIARCASGDADAARDRLMQSQGSWRTEQDIARAAGIAPEALQQCMAGGSMAAVQKDRSMGQQLGVRATPTLVLGYTSAAGKFTPVKNVRGDQPYGVVRSAVQELIAGGGGETVQSSRKVTSQLIRDAN